MHSHLRQATFLGQAQFACGRAMLLRPSVFRLLLNGGDARTFTNIYRPMRYVPANLPPAPNISQRFVMEARGQRALIAFRLVTFGLLSF